MTRWINLHLWQICWLVFAYNLGWLFYGATHHNGVAVVMSATGCAMFTYSIGDCRRLRELQRLADDWERDWRRKP